MKHLRTVLGIAAIFLSGASTVNAQQPVKKTDYSFTLKEAIDYGIANNVNVKNAFIDSEIAKEKVKETVGFGLPNVSGNFVISHSPTIQPFVVEPPADDVSPFGAPQPGLKKGEAIAFRLSLANTAFGTLSVNQLIFDGSYIVGLKASNTYKQLSEKQYQQSKVQVAENVTKAYLGVLVNTERSQLLDINISRLDSSLRELIVIQKNGLVEQIDVNRLEVALNNLKTERQKTRRLVELSRQLLKFQMGMGQADELTLTDKLDSFKPDFTASLSDNFNYSDRIEYSVLETQRDLAKLDLKNKKADYLPDVYGSFTLGTTTGASEFGNLFVSDRYFKYSNIGVSISMPIWNFSRWHTVQQSKLQVMKAENGFTILKQAIDLEQRSAITNLRNAQESLQMQERNLNLAKEVVRVTKIKYQQGVGSNIELVNAESSLKESQTNYYAALYDAVIAKVDLDKANGQLYK